MGLLTFKGSQPTLAEARTAKNYLDDKELRAMGQLVSGYLDFAERQAEKEQPMTMDCWMEAEYPIKKQWTMPLLNIVNINNAHSAMWSKII